MENLTRSLRVAHNAPDCNPVPDHDLVIFKKVGSGLEFREFVPAGSRFQKRFIERADFLAFAVSRDENLRHTFSHPDRHSDQLHTYILRFTVCFKVCDPRLLTEKLERDPVRCIQQEIARVIGSAARHLPWHLIAEGHEDLERILLTQEVTTEERVVLSNREQIRRLALSFGLSVTGIFVERSLTDRELKVAIEEREIDESEYLEDRAHKREIGRKIRQGKLEEYEDRRDVEKAITRVVVKSIENSKDVASAADTILTLERLSHAKRAAENLTGPALPNVKSSQLLSAAPQDGLTGELLAEVLKLIADLGSNSPAGCRLGSSMLHLVAELLLGEEADDEILEQYANAMVIPLQDVCGRLDYPHIELTDRLRKPLQLKAEIAREAKR